MHYNKFKIKITRYLIVVLLICSYALSIRADEQLNLILPTLTYEEAIHHMENLFDKEVDLKRYVLKDILYDYITGEWVFHYNMIQGSHFTIIMNDKDPTKYRGIGGA